VRALLSDAKYGDLLLIELKSVKSHCWQKVTNKETHGKRANKE
jgi:hypothetical protein